MGSTTGNYSRMPSDHVAKRFMATLMQEKKPIVDYDWNAQALLGLSWLRAAQEMVSPSGFGGASWQVLQAAVQANNFKIGWTDYWHGYGAGLVGGFPATLTAEIDYTTSTANLAEQIFHKSMGLSATILTDTSAQWTVNALAGRTLTPNILYPAETFAIASNTATAIVVVGNMLTTGHAAAGHYYRIELSTPGAGRTDNVYLDCYLDEIDAVEDTSLDHNLGGSVPLEACRRFKLIQWVRVEENAVAVADYVDADGNSHSVEPIATLTRTASANIATAMIADEREPYIGSSLEVRDARGAFVSLDARISSGVSDLAALLASTDLGEGASLVGIHDDPPLYAATTVEAALAEVMGALNTHAGAADPHSQYPLAAGTETISGVWTHTNTLLLANSVGLYAKDTGGTARMIAFMNAGNNIVLGDTGFPLYLSSSVAIVAALGFTLSHTDGDFTLLNTASLKAHDHTSGKGGAVPTTSLSGTITDTQHGSRSGEVAGVPLHTIATHYTQAATPVTGTDGMISTEQLSGLRLAYEMLGLQLGHAAPAYDEAKLADITLSADTLYGVGTPGYTEIGIVCHNLTLNSGVKLLGRRIFIHCTGTLTLAASAVISAYGTDLNVDGGESYVDPAADTLDSRAASILTLAGGAATTAGGGGAGCGASGGDNGTADSVDGTTDAIMARSLLIGEHYYECHDGGGHGGRGANNGGLSGGVIFITCHTLVVSASALIIVAGQVGLSDAANPGYGAGGGGGGAIFIESRALSVGTLLSLFAQGGAGGAATTTGGGGGGGGGGLIYILAGDYNEDADLANVLCSADGGAGGAGTVAGLDGVNGYVVKRLVSKKAISQHKPFLQ